MTENIVCQVRSRSRSIPEERQRLLQEEFFYLPMTEISHALCRREQLSWIRQKRIEGYHLFRSIGRGNFGEVFFAENGNAGCNAVKIFTSEKDSSESFDLEYHGMQMVQYAGKHPHLVPIEGVAEKTIEKYVRERRRNGN